MPRPCPDEPSDKIFASHISLPIVAEPLLVRCCCLSVDVPNKDAVANTTTIILSSQRPEYRPSQIGSPRPTIFQNDFRYDGQVQTKPRSQHWHEARRLGVCTPIRPPRLWSVKSVLDTHARTVCSWLAW